MITTARGGASGKTGGYFPPDKDYEPNEKEEEKFGEILDKYGVEEEYCPCNEHHCMMKPGYDQYGKKKNKGRGELRRRLKEEGGGEEEEKEEEDDGEDEDEEEEENPYIGAGFCVPKLYRPKMRIFRTPPGYYKIFPSMPSYSTMYSYADGSPNSDISFGSRQLLMYHKIEGENQKKNPQDYVCPPNSKPCEEEEEEEEELSM